MEVQVKLEQHGSQPLAVVRRQAALHQVATVIPAACGVVWQVMRAQKITGLGRHIALYLDDTGNLEVGVEVETPFAGHGEVIGSATPAGRVATAVHFGPYNRLPEVHHAIRQWCAANSCTLQGPNWECYGHWLDEWNNDPTQIRTDVFYLLREEAGSAG